MIVLSSEQYAALVRDFRDRYHREVLGIVKEAMPFATSGKQDDDLLAQIAAAHLQANDRGISGRADVAKYAVLHVGLGPEFDDEPRIDTYLRREDLSHTEKLDSLCDRLGARLEAG